MQSSAVKLGINIDHVATIREARGTRYPDPVQAAYCASDAGADSVTVHLREDRRHIQQRDVAMLMDALTIPLNLEMAATDEMFALAREYSPQKCCIVPEKREELTTEGGLDVRANEAALAKIVEGLAAVSIEVSLFIDPSMAQIDAAARIGAPVVELHTGSYADAQNDPEQNAELDKLIKAANAAHDAGLIVNAGHGLHYHNVAPVAAIECINELNIGHSIVSRALMSGFHAAVSEMKQLIREARLL